jgi:hypothetical protein
VSKFVAFLERYDGNGEYVQGGVSKSSILQLRKTQVGQDLLRHSYWIPQDSWRDMWSVHDIMSDL